ncbi:MAG: hypothetical protein M3Q42_06655 [Pseudomonadota bacterium]|nr:hypothetical protein [Pseudomonadota bacterium]
MIFTNRLLLIACLALPMLVACQQEDQTQDVVAEAPLTAPAGGDDEAWGAYLSQVVTRNMEGVTNNPYLYYLPSAESEDFEGSYARLQEEVRAAMHRGILAGNLVAFGSPESKEMADIVVAAFNGVDEASMDGVKLLFIGNAADSARVEAAVAPAGVNYTFVEAK